MLTICRILTVSFILLAGSLQADDTELFVSDIGEERNISPQVLIMFDNSGSMASTEQVAATPFDPSKSYTSSTKIYWAESGDGIPSLNSDNYLQASENKCFASVAAFEATGKYSGNVRRWKPNKKKWKTLSENQGSLYDCREDWVNDYTTNQDEQDGYPINGNTDAYSTTKGDDVFGGDDAVTLYSADYVYWNENTGTSSQSRISIAKEAITNLINSTSSVDFGLVIFNHSAGGRVVGKVQKRTEAETQSLINTIDGLKAETWTPLTETMYEAYRYYAGEAVYYGDDGGSATPSRDLSAETNKVYNSPCKDCQQLAYIILMTDGEPTEDSGANSRIQTLTGNGPIEGSYLPTLAQWMNNSDVNGNILGEQNIITHTIGFGQDVIDDAGQLLSETAVRGGGKYFPAASAKDLDNAFNETILAILNNSSSLTSPAIANNNFDRTRSLDSLYYSMFFPSNKSVWKGNIKKLKMNSSGIIVDSGDQPAIDADGNIKENASTYWGGVADGNSVNEGGVAAMLSAATTRKVLSNIGTEGSLIEPSKANLKSYYSDVSTDDELAGKLVIDSADLDTSLDWLLGIDVADSDADNSKTDFRSDIFADPLHSTPLAITYTESGEQVVRLLVGTNAGFLHMFTDQGDSVKEEWAFIPDELLQYGIALKDQADMAAHSYGMDLAPVAIKTYDEDGLDKIIAIAGMRRGGDSYYALNVKTPAAPTLLWKIDSDTAGFSELGQTWSVPAPGKLAYQSGTTTIEAPVIVFGGGYDTNKDTCSPSSDNNCDDLKGRAIYIVNAETGAQIWKVEGGSCDTDEIHCLRDSIPAQVSLLDSDADGNIDRIYAGDTGGNVWRVDLKGTNTKEWALTKLAALGGDTATTDRRFFTAPVIARTYVDQVTGSIDGGFEINAVPYDGVLIGSGDRANPASDTTVLNSFYLIHDYNIHPAIFGEENQPALKTVNDLYNISSDPITNYKGENVLSAYKDLTSGSGWRYNFTSAGEKSLGRATLLEGTVYFTSFVPNSLTNIDCGISDLGQGWLYAVNLHSGINHLTETKESIGARVPDALVIHSGVNEKGESVIRLLGVGAGDEIVVVDPETEETETVNAGTKDTGVGMIAKRIYSYFEER